MQASKGQVDLQKLDLSFWSVLRAYFCFFRFIKPCLARPILIAALMFVPTSAGQVAIFLMRDLTDQVLLAVDRATADRTSLLAQILAVQAGLGLVGTFLWKARETMNWCCFYRGTIDLQYVRHLHNLPLSFLRKRAPGEKLSRATSDMMSNGNDPFDEGPIGMWVRRGNRSAFGGLGRAVRR
jgi:ABC-type multidrug transport system fused ATPase/permease subunit